MRQQRTDVLDEKLFRREFFLQPAISLRNLWAAPLNQIPRFCLSNASTLTLGVDWDLPKDLQLWPR